MSNKCQLCPEGHLSALPDRVASACCGHGNIAKAYVQFESPNDIRLEGQEALEYFSKFDPPQIKINYDAAIFTTVLVVSFIIIWNWSS